jgi:hypothetical protein
MEILTFGFFCCEWSCGEVYLNLVGDDYKDKQCVMNYKSPRLKIVLQTAVLVIAYIRSYRECTHDVIFSRVPGTSHSAC